jgi:hypothetical protein
LKTSRGKPKAKPAQKPVVSEFALFAKAANQSSGDPAAGLRQIREMAAHACSIVAK